MKHTIKILIFVFIGILLTLLLIPISSPNGRSVVEMDAVRVAVQHILLYASENEGEFPTSISKVELRNIEHFPSSIDPEALTFYLREGLNIADTDSTTPIVCIGLRDGHLVGFVNGFVSFELDWEANQPEHTIRLNAPGLSREQ